MTHDDSRTQKSIRNGKYALAFYALNLLLGFVSRRVFIHNLGSELLGLNTTIGSILEVLNIAELGIGVATSAMLYKPLCDGDNEQVGNLVALQGWLYRRVAMVVLVGAVGLACAFPLIFADGTVDLWKAYATFAAFLVGSLLSYLFTYKQVLFSADQKEYMVTLTVRLPQLGKQIAQIAAILFLPHAYVWWLVFHVLFAVISALMLSRAVRREYPHLVFPVHLGAQLKSENPDVLVKIKQIFVQRMAGVVFRQSSSVIIFTYASLTLVAAYGNYMMVFLGVVMLVDSIFNGVQAGVGNLVAKGQREQTVSVFYELFALRFGVAVVCALSFYLLSGPFVTLWVGEDLLLPAPVVMLLSVMLFVDVIRPIVGSFLNAYALFSDVWAPIAEAVLNVGMSLLLGYFFGLEGVLCGVLFSLFVIVLLWKPYFLFRRGMHSSLWLYWVCFAKFTVVSLAAVGVCYALLHGFANPASESWMSFALYAVSTLVLVSLVVGLSLCGCSQSARDVVVRIKQMVLSKLVR